MTVLSSHSRPNTRLLAGGELTAAGGMAEATSHPLACGTGVSPRASWYSSWWRKLDPRGPLRTLLSLNDTPHSIALGTAIGVFVAMTPTIGVQMFLVMLIALATRRLFHFNRLAGMAAVYITNPLTMIPIYWFNYRVGTVFLRETVTEPEFERILHYRNFQEWWASLQAIFLTVGAPLILGSFVVGVVLGVATYPIVLKLTRRWRRDRTPLSPPALSR